MKNYTLENRREFIRYKLQKLYMWPSSNNRKFKATCASLKRYFTENSRWVPLMRIQSIQCLSNYFNPPAGHNIKTQDKQLIKQLSYAQKFSSCSFVFSLGWFLWHKSCVQKWRDFPTFKQLKIKTVIIIFFYFQLIYFINRTAKLFCLQLLPLHLKATICIISKR